MLGVMKLTVSTVLALLALAGSAHAARFDLARWLDKPDVKLVAVEVYSDYCEPCKAAAPRWEKLRKRYKDDGLMLVVVNVDDYDSDRQCKTLPWRPDLLMCSPEIGEALGVCTGGRCKVPQAFLWSWQGNLLVSCQGHIDEVEVAIKRYLGDHPRVLVVAKGEDGKPDQALKRQVEAALGRTGKLTVVADAEQRKRLAAVRKASHGASKRDDQRCEVGAEVSANSELTVERFEGGALSMVLADAVSGCQRAAASVNIDERGLDKAVQNATFELMTQLKQRNVQMPLGSRSRSPRRREVGVEDISGEDEGDWEAAADELATVQFTSVPAGAQVFVDGKEVCRKAPCKRDVKPGRHQVKMTLDRYVDSNKRVSLEAGQIVGWTLKPTFATLTVKSTPPGIAVTIDGEAAVQTPLVGHEVPEGRHTVEVGDRCHYPKTKRLNLPRGKSYTMDVKPKPKRGGLKLRAVDSRGDAVAADVYIDGKRVGRTPDVFTLDVCAEELEVRHPELHSWRSRLSLRAKKTTELTAEFSGALEREVDPVVAKSPPFDTAYKDGGEAPYVAPDAKVAADYDEPPDFAEDGAETQVDWFGLRLLGGAFFDMHPFTENTPVFAGEIVIGAVRWEDYYLDTVRLGGGHPVLFVWGTSGGLRWDFGGSEFRFGAHLSFLVYSPSLSGAELAYLWDMESAGTFELGVRQFSYPTGLGAYTGMRW